MQTITRIEKHAKSICDGEYRVSPGTPARFTGASTPCDLIWQGDLGLEIMAKVPDDYKLTQSKSKQLVLGNTEGARHCLDSLDGVQLYVHDEWTEESLFGPCFVLSKERTVLHPTHGAVTIPAGFTVRVRYQREWDKEERKARRARD